MIESEPATTAKLPVDNGNRLEPGNFPTDPTLVDHFDHTRHVLVGRRSLFRAPAHGTPTRSGESRQDCDQPVLSYAAANREVFAMIL